MQMQKRKWAFLVLAMMILTSSSYFLFTHRRWAESLYSSYIFPMLCWVPIVGWLTAYNFPPADYYAPIVQFPLGRGEITEKFSCKYRGRHLIRIKYISSDSLDMSGVRLTGRIERLDGTACLEFDVADSRLFVRFGDGDQYPYNYHYKVFHAPEDVPLDTPLVLRIKCSGDVGNLLKANPDAMVEFAKDFDK